jgi:REP element-mobilizing transposase RayT
LDFFEGNNLETNTTFSFSESEERVFLDSNEKILFGLIDPDTTDISYTCFLIPCSPFYQLSGDLAKLIPEWLHQICAPYNWEIEFITVDPNYLQWGLRLIRSTQAGQFMQKIRHETSELILSTFEHIRDNNLTNNFWASGYLVILGTRPNPKEMIEQYICLSRRQKASFSA